MTGEERDTLARLWAAGLPVKQIARRMGYCPGTIDLYARIDRDRCPYRHRQIDRGLREALTDRVMAGDLTAGEAAEIAGCSIKTVRTWTHRRRLAAYDTHRKG